MFDDLRVISVLFDSYVHRLFRIGGIFRDVLFPFIDSYDMIPRCGMRLFTIYTTAFYRLFPHSTCEHCNVNQLQRDPTSCILSCNVAPSDNGRDSIGHGMMFCVSSCAMGPRHRETAGCPSGTPDGADPFRVDGRWVCGELDDVLQYQPCAARGQWTYIYAIG